MMPHELGLLARAANFGMIAAGEEQARIEQRLQTEAGTPLIIGLRVLTMHATILATGTIAVFESILQQTFGWKQPFRELDGLLRRSGFADLAERVIDYRDAINVLKHGAGRSHDRLLRRKDNLDFRVRAVEQPFHREGDVDEIPTLVRADAAFVRNCGLLVEEVVEALRTTIPNASF